MERWLLIFAGGGAGTLFRYLIGLSFGRLPVGLPVATFCANAIACVVFALVLRQQAFFDTHPLWRLVILVGFCGGLSTFSTFSFETFEMLKQGMMLAALLNILFSCVACVVIFYIFNR